ncbi:MAG: hypothetical protein HYR60_06630 [Acidobacteria bacterium]|nr:hypothetical protein [Acidobacteriota bacterium]
MRPEDRTAEAMAEPAQLPAPAPPPVWTTPSFPFPSFHNPMTVRIGWLAASVATLLNMVLPYGFIIWLVAAGFFSVYLFSRRTGQSLTVRVGARMGWITGILSYVIVTVLFTLNMFALTRTSGGIAGFYREQVAKMPVRDASVDQALELLNTTSGQVMLVATFLVFMFAIVTVLCMAGGALGAKVLEKD